MQRLGYTRYVAQGGDWGNAVIGEHGAAAAAGLARHPHQHAGHGSRRDLEGARRRAGRRRPASRPTRSSAWDQLDYFYKKGLGYAIEMNNRPQTLYGIADSPVGLAAWMIDHDVAQLRADRPRLRREDRGTDAGRHPRQRHALLADEHRDLVGAPLLGQRAAPATGGFFDVRGIKIPVAVSAFPDEIYQAPRSWAERAYPKLIHYNRLHARAATSRPGSSRRSSSRTCARRSRRLLSRTRVRLRAARRERGLRHEKHPIRPTSSSLRPFSQSSQASRFGPRRRAKADDRPRPRSLRGRLGLAAPHPDPPARRLRSDRRRESPRLARRRRGDHEAVHRRAEGKRRPRRPLLRRRGDHRRRGREPERQGARLPRGVRAGRTASRSAPSARSTRWTSIPR